MTLTKIHLLLEESGMLKHFGRRYGGSFRSRSDGCGENFSGGKPEECDRTPTTCRVRGVGLSQNNVMKKTTVFPYSGCIMVASVIFQEYAKNLSEGRFTCSRFSIFRFKNK